MGTGNRKKSGNLFTGSRLVVDGQGNSGVLRNKSNGFNNIFKTANTGPGPSLNPIPTPLPIPENSFTINYTDFISYGNGPDITPNGTSGFDSGPGQSGVGRQEYIIGNNDMSQELIDSIINLFTVEGLSTDSTGYVFNVTWGPGSTIPNGKAMIGYYYESSGPYYGNIQLSSISTENNDWMTSGQNMFDLPLAALGTFNFPATFTLYKPIISNPSHWWC
jgi:hypothetical protein